MRKIFVVSLTKNGIYLPQPVFAHGQYYVANGRCARQDQVEILAFDESGRKTNKTKNIVYEGALL